MKLKKDLELENIFKDYQNEYLNKGTSGIVYKISEEECLKLFKYYNECDAKVLELLKKIKPNNFYEIKELIYNGNNDFIGYTMKYYEDKNLDLLTMPTEYLLDNLNGICNSINKLTNNNVLVTDLISKNTILTNNKIIIIDVDNFKFNKLYTSINDLNKHNLSELRSLLIDLFIQSKIKYHKGEIIETNKDNIFDIKDNFSRTYKVLRKYKYPIDYFRKY